MPTLPDIHQALFKHLSLYAPLVALIGQRCYPGIAPTSAPFPRVTVQELDDGRHYHFQGVSATNDTSFQVDCWALSMAEAKKVARVITDLWDAEIQNIPIVWDGLEVDGVFIEAELDTWEEARDGSERIFYRRSLTITCWHEREVASATD